MVLEMPMRLMRPMAMRPSLLRHRRHRAREAKGSIHHRRRQPSEREETLRKQQKKKLRPQRLVDGSAPAGTMMPSTRPRLLRRKKLARPRRQKRKSPRARPTASPKPLSWPPLQPHLLARKLPPAATSWTMGSRSPDLTTRTKAQAAPSRGLRRESAEERAHPSAGEGGEEDEACEEEDAGASDLSSESAMF